MFEFLRHKKIVADLNHQIDMWKGLVESHLEEIARLRQELQEMRNESSYDALRRREECKNYLQKRDEFVQQSSDQAKEQIRRQAVFNAQVSTAPPPVTVQHYDHGADLATGIVIGSILSDHSGYGQSDSSYSSSSSHDSGSSYSSSSYDSGSSCDSGSSFSGGCD